MLCNWFFVVLDFIYMWVSFCEIRKCCVTDYLWFLISYICEFLWNKKLLWSEDLRYLIYQWVFYVTVRYRRTSRLSWSTPSRPSMDRMSEETPPIDWSPTPGTPCRERLAHAPKTQHNTVYILAQSIVYIS